MVTDPTATSVTAGAEPRDGTTVQLETGRPAAVVGAVRRDSVGARADEHLAADVPDDGVRAGTLHDRFGDLALGVREEALARGQATEQLGTLLVAAQRGDQAAGQDHRRDVRLRRQDASDLRADHRDLDRPGVHPAVGLGERQAEHAHLREPAPEPLVEPGILPGHVPAALRVDRRVVALEQPADRVAQGLLLLVQREVHVLLPTVRGWCRR